MLILDEGWDCTLKVRYMNFEKATSKKVFESCEGAIGGGKQGAHRFVFCGVSSITLNF